MPHILFEEWEGFIHEFHAVVETLHDNIENEMYTGKHLENANAFLSNAETWIENVDSEHRASGETIKANIEQFLGS